MFKLMVREEGAKAFKTIDTRKAFVTLAFKYSRMHDVAVKIVKGRKIIAKKGY